MRATSRSSEGMRPDGCLPRDRPPLGPPRPYFSRTSTGTLSTDAAARRRNAARRSSHCSLVRSEPQMIPASGRASLTATLLVSAVPRRITRGGVGLLVARSERADCDATTSTGSRSRNADRRWHPRYVTFARRSLYGFERCSKSVSPKSVTARERRSPESDRVTAVLQRRLRGGRDRNGGECCPNLAR